MSYLKWNEQKIEQFDEQEINALYNEGYVFGRNEKGLLSQTRSLRIDLSRFEMSSENRRILRKTEEVHMHKIALPFANYSWEIGKLAKDFYTTKFGEGVFSANKMKVIMTDPRESNFNAMLQYRAAEITLGYCIILETNELIHYCYPFYATEEAPANLGLGMMLKAIVYAKEQNKKYIYLGSAQRPTDTYKLQFEGLEWFDGHTWKQDTHELKELLK